MAPLNWTWIGLASISVLMLPVLILLWPLTLIALVIGICHWSRQHQQVLAAKSTHGTNATAEPWSVCRSAMA